MRSLLLALALALLTSLGQARAFDAAQQDWYVWTRDDVRLYVLQAGRAPAPDRDSPILVLHGGVGAEHGYLLPALQPLMERHRFTLFDQRGSLRSPADADRITLDGMMADIEEIRQELGAARVRLVAHSMGALLAYAYLQQHPEQVESLVFIGPVFPFHSGVSPDAPLFEALGLPADDADYMARVVADYRAFARDAEARADALIQARGLDGEGLSGRQKTEAWKIRFAASNVHHLDRWEQMVGGQAFYNPSVFPALVENAGGQAAWAQRWSGLFEALQRFPRPSTFIIGKQDFLDPAFRFWPSIVDKIPQARLVALDAAGHNPWIDQPAEFAQALDEALRPLSE